MSEMEARSVDGSALPIMSLEGRVLKQVSNETAIKIMDQATCPSSTTALRNPNHLWLRGHIRFHERALIELKEYRDLARGALGYQSGGTRCLNAVLRAEGVGQSAASRNLPLDTHSLGTRRDKAMGRSILYTKGWFISARCSQYKQGQCPICVYVRDVVGKERDVNAGLGEPSLEEYSNLPPQPVIAIKKKKKNSSSSTKATKRPTVTIEYSRQLGGVAVKPTAVAHMRMPTAAAGGFLGLSPTAQYHPSMAMGIPTAMMPVYNMHGIHMAGVMPLAKREIPQAGAPNPGFFQHQILQQQQRHHLQMQQLVGLANAQQLQLQHIQSQNQFMGMNHMSRYGSVPVGYPIHGTAAPLAVAYNQQPSQKATAAVSLRQVPLPPSPKATPSPPSISAPEIMFASASSSSGETEEKISGASVGPSSSGVSSLFMSLPHNNISPVSTSQ